MTELLPCPFCGGEAQVQHQSRELYGDVVDWYGVYCKKQFCGFVSGQNTEAEAIAAWNTRVDYHGYEQAAIEAWESIKAWNSRAERTCEFNIKDNMSETEGMGDVWIECSACHCAFDYFADDWLMKMSYCPNCGARVVDGKEGE